MRLTRGIGHSYSVLSELLEYVWLNVDGENINPEDYPPEAPVETKDQPKIFSEPVDPIDQDSNGTRASSTFPKNTNPKGGSK